MRRWKLALLGSIATLASINAMACYTVTDRDGRIVYNSTEAPVDMRRPLHETVPYRFPGGHMVFGSETCPSPSQVSTRVIQVSTREMGGPPAARYLPAQRAPRAARN
ncbi:hypothetical protein [Caenimonas koreensis]|uniref:hypothetical protein n=1 Tax=Caenimonas koreensis TaxID=367474 RepID=UPI003784F317